MKKIIAVNGSPRLEWNTGTLIREAAKGAGSQGVQVKVIDLYKLEKFTGCVSCFGCKLPQNLGRCVCRDGLYELLEDIRTADGLILGSPNYLGDVSAGFRAFYERLIFQYISYKKDPTNYPDRRIPVLFIMTSNCAEDRYSQIGYDVLLEKYRGNFERMLGPTRILISSDTLQVNDYNKYNWTMFDSKAKKARREAVFPKDKEKAFSLGADMATGNWK